MTRLRYILFLLITFSIIATNIWGIGGSAVKGLSLKNAAIYFSIIVLLIIQLAERKLYVRNIPAILPISIIFVLGMCSLLYAGIFAEGVKLDRFESLVEFKSKLFDPVFLYIAGSTIFKRPQQSQAALKTLVNIYGVLNILALLSFFSGISLIGREILSHGGQRFSSFGPIANQGAYALAFLLPLIYYFYSESKKILHKSSGMIMIMACIGGILLTGSRGAYLLIPVQVMGFCLLTRNIRLFSLATIAGTAAAALLMMVNPDFLMAALNRITLLNSDNLREISSGRTMIWEGIFHIMSNQPIALVTGVGWGTYRAHIFHVLGSTPAAHNYYLKVMLEIGIIGFGVLITGIIVYLTKIKNLAKSSSSLFFQCAMCSFFALFWNTMLASLESFMLYYAWFIGLMTNYSLLLKESQTSFDQNTALNR